MQVCTGVYSNNFDPHQHQSRFALNIVSCVVETDGKVPSRSIDI